MRNIWRIFFKAKGASPWLTLLCLVSANLAQGIGVATLLPLLAVATDTDSSSSVVRYVREAFEALGLPLSIAPLIVLVVAATVISSSLKFLAMRYVGFAEAEVTTQLRSKLTRYLIAARWSYYVGQPAGRINHALMSLTQTAGNAYASAARFVALIIETAVITVVALAVSFYVTLVGLALGLAVARLLNWFVRRSRKAGGKGNERQKEMAVLWSNTMGNLKPLKAMARHTALFGMFENKLMQWRAVARKQVIHKEARTCVQEIVFAAFIGVGAFLALVVWSVPIVELIVIGIVLSRAVKGIGKIQAQYQLVVVNEVPFLELEDFIEDVRKAGEPDFGSAPARFEHGCGLEHVTFSYGRGPVLNDVTVDIPIGNVTVITGPSGAGKTTILDLLLGLHRPQGGAVTVDGQPLDRIDIESWRKIVGYVPQELVLFHDTILANVQLGDPAITREEVESALKAAGAWEFVSKLPEGVDTVVGFGGSRISGGQRQRIALARAIVTNPRLLVLDEATSALDPESERLMCATVKRLAKDEAKAVLAITHRPAFLEIADTVYEVVDGQARSALPPQTARAPLATSSLGA